jgi:hypothetical protein
MSTHTNGAIVTRRLMLGLEIEPAWLAADFVGDSWRDIVFSVLAAGATGRDAAAAFFEAITPRPNRDSLAAAVLAVPPDAVPDSANQPAFPWQFLTLKDAYAPRPAIEYAVKGLIEVPSVNIWYAYPGALKTLFLQSQAMCIATGRAWLHADHGEDASAVLTFPTFHEPTPVLWIDMDTGERRSKEHFEAFGRAYGANPDSTPVYFLSMPEPGINLLDDSIVRGLIAATLEYGAKVVYLDSLIDVSGTADENSAEMGPVIAAARKLASSAGCAVNIIHHERKATAGNPRQSDTLRGHSSINGKTDYTFLVKREPKSDIVSIIATKERGAPVPRFSARWHYTHKLTESGEDTNELATAWFAGVASPDSTPADRETANIDAAIRAGLSENQYMTKTEIVAFAQKVAGCGRNAAMDTIKSMELAGVIRELSTEETQKVARDMQRPHMTKADVMTLA